MALDISIRDATVGEFHALGVHCKIDTAKYTGSGESTIYLPRANLFLCLLDGWVDERVEFTFDGMRPSRIENTDTSVSVFVPLGLTLRTQRRGASQTRLFQFQVEPRALERVLGAVSPFAFTQHYGRNPMQPGIVERLAAICERPDDYPLVYGESLATILLLDLLFAFGEMSARTSLSPKDGSERFTRVLDFIEEFVEQDFGLCDLASLAGLSVTHFAHAFKQQYGIAPYRYVIERRIARAKILLRTTDLTVAAIAARTGFSSQSRFSQVFSRAVGAAPSAYRLAKNNLRRF
jgi:AraC-like DNA-binding protein